jgi:hypothetical protein
MKLLITFGCSWTFGIGLNYEPGMDYSTYQSGYRARDLAESHSFRAILSNRYNLHNINFARGGTSNQTQFRLAEDFFSSSEFQTVRSQYSDITVLWGITSVMRNETYFSKEKLQKSFFYSDNSLLSKAIVADHFNQQHEISMLGKKIQFWDTVFDAFKIRNMWFDTFNHHDYNIASDVICNDYLKVAKEGWPSWQEFAVGDFTKVSKEIQNEILDQEKWDFYLHCKPVSTRIIDYQKSPRDFLSKLSVHNGMINLDNRYHLADWAEDSNRLKYLTNIGLVNPHSYHPTKIGHQQLADMLSVYFE